MNFLDDYLNGDKYLDVTKDMVFNVLNAKLPIIHGNKKENNEFSLNEISFDNRKSEIEFNYTEDNLKNYFNGFIDLLFVRDGYYSILDWKSDKLSDEFKSFNIKEELKGQVDRRYSIQRTLYAYTLINWLKNFDGDDEEKIFNEHFGGVYYVFLRGCNKDTGNGIYAHTWNNFKELKDSYDEIIKLSKGK